MGAEQSSSRAGTANQSAYTEPRKTCYYEVLGVERQAGDDDIKKAYRKKALELHPDRNINNVEISTKRFAEVQTAYEILSDAQERAWYDSHRDAILNGDADVAGDPTSDHPTGGNTPATAIFSLMGRFNSSVPMTDGSGGFFGILNAFFDQLAMEETSAAEWSGIEPLDYPAFGRADDDYDTVAKPFYRVWSGFATKKSFSWRDKYRLSDAPDRRVRRLMEKENKKFREEGVREFNDAVQSLVAFVRKRDPRYIPNTQSEAERQAILRSSAATQAARSRAAHQEKVAAFSVPEWAQSRDEGDQIADEFSESEEESEIEEIECVVCNKTFKSENQFAAHEKSKKHIKAVQQLRWQMKKENADFDLHETKAAPKTATEASEDEVEASAAESMPVPDIEGPSDSKTDAGDSGSADPAKEQEEIPSTDETDNDEYAPRSAVEDRILPTENVKPVDESITDVDSAAASVNGLTLDDAPGGKKGKARLKREKKAARQAAEATAPDPFSCAVCKEKFPSRTKLFDHIKELEHAAPVPVARGGKKKNKR
ncbi:hypothetical protein QBC39DRAFT_363437 [Podospora conica]|nr:hypothetical protein QBC39DRAFT_363437 [Schizothecium conicum]